LNFGAVAMNGRRVENRLAFRVKSKRTASFCDWKRLGKALFALECELTLTSRKGSGRVAPESSHVTSLGPKHGSVATDSVIAERRHARPCPTGQSQSHE